MVDLSGFEETVGKAKIGGRNMEYTVPSASNMADLERCDSTELAVKASSIFAVAVAHDSSHPAVPFVWSCKWNDATLPMR